NAAASAVIYTPSLHDALPISRTLALTVSAAGIDKAYDGSTAATVTLSDDHIGNDDVVDSYTSATFDTKDVGTNKVVSVSGISISGANAGNYTLGNTTASTTADLKRTRLNSTHDQIWIAIA